MKYTELQNGSDIRGVAMEIAGGKPVNLTMDAAKDLTKAFVLWIAKKTGKKQDELTIALGRDSRVTGPEFIKVCTEAAAKYGCKVFDCGMATTPAMFMATVFDDFACDGSIMFTASHLPSERNGMKFFTKEGGLDKKDITELITLAEELPKFAGNKGKVLPKDLMTAYSNHLKNLICRGLSSKEEERPLSGLKILVDAGNGAGGFYVSKVLEPLGADCTGSQFLEPDGYFPNHQPNPENKAAMESICSAVQKYSPDLGVIFDTDVDRSSAVDEKGREIARNRIVALAAVIASEGHGGTTIVTDSITSPQLAEFLTKDLGLKHLRFKRGYKNVINKGIELNKEGIDCQLAIETSGHAAMKENYFLDDGAYLATKIVIKAAQLKKEGKSISSLLESLKDPKEAVEIRFNVNCEDFSDYAQNVLDDLRAAVEEGKFKGFSLELPNYEGVRVNADEKSGNGWFLMRKSLHDPVIPLNIESDEEGGVEKINKIILDFLKSYDKVLS